MLTCSSFYSGSFKRAKVFSFNFIGLDVRLIFNVQRLYETPRESNIVCTGATFYDDAIYEGILHLV